MQRIHRFLSSAYPTGLPPPERRLSDDTAIRPFRPGHVNLLIFLRAIGNPYKNRIFATLCLRPKRHGKCKISARLMKPTRKQIWTIAYPILISLLMENMIGLTDTAFLGRVGEVELGASALGSVYYLVIFMLGFGFGIGAQILIARRNGEKAYALIGPLFQQGLLFLLSLATVMFVISHTFTPMVLRSLISSDEVYEAAVSYTNWRVFGFFFAFVAIMFRAFFVGITNTKTLTLNSIVMVLSNVVLNYVLVFGKLGLPAMGIAGAAIASSASEMISMVFFS